MLTKLFPINSVISILVEFIFRQYNALAPDCPSFCKAFARARLTAVKAVSDPEKAPERNNRAMSISVSFIQNVELFEDCSYSDKVIASKNALIQFYN